MKVIEAVPGCVQAEAFLTCWACHVASAVILLPWAQETAIAFGSKDWQMMARNHVATRVLSALMQSLSRTEMSSKLPNDCLSELQQCWGFHATNFHFLPVDDVSIEDAQIDHIEEYSQIEFCPASSIDFVALLQLVRQVNTAHNWIVEWYLWKKKTSCLRM